MFLFTPLAAFALWLQTLNSSALKLINYFLGINCIEGPCIRLLFTDSLQVAAVFYCRLRPGIAPAFVHTEWHGFSGQCRLWTVLAPKETA